MGVFALPVINNLLLEGPGQKQICTSRPSGFRGCPKLTILALCLDFKSVALSTQQSLRERIGAFVFLGSFSLRECSMEQALVA